MTKNIITYKTYQEQFNQLEQNLNQNCDLASKILNDFVEKMDEGDYADLSLKFVLEINLENARKTLQEFIKLPISGC
jgi:hypothetical protein